MKLEIIGSQSLVGSDVILKKNLIIVIIEVDDFYFLDFGFYQEVGILVFGGEQCGLRFDLVDAVKGRYFVDFY